MIAKTNPSLVATWLQQLAKPSCLDWDLKEIFGHYRCYHYSMCM